MDSSKACQQTLQVHLEVRIDKYSNILDKSPGYIGSRFNGYIA